MTSKVPQFTIFQTKWATATSTRGIITDYVPCRGYAAIQLSIRTEYQADVYIDFTDESNKEATNIVPLPAKIGSGLPVYTKLVADNSFTFLSFPIKGPLVRVRVKYRAKVPATAEDILLKKYIKISGLLTYTPHYVVV